MSDIFFTLGNIFFHIFFNTYASHFYADTILINSPETIKNKMMVILDMIHIHKTLNFITNVNFSTSLDEVL
jgi:hypothetical protein